MLNYSDMLTDNFIGTIHYVNSDGSADFESIQTAINFAFAEDIIMVFPGTYEKIYVTKPLTLIGMDKETTIIAAPNWAQQAVEIPTDGDGTTITGFNLTNGECGIAAWGTNGPVYIVDNVFFDCKFGIYIGQPDNCFIQGNMVRKCILVIFLS